MCEKDKSRKKTRGTRSLARVFLSARDRIIKKKKRTKAKRRGKKKRGQSNQKKKNRQPVYMYGERRSTVR